MNEEGRREGGSGWLPPEPPGTEGEGAEHAPAGPAPPTQPTEPQHPPPHQAAPDAFGQQQGYGQPPPPPGYQHQPSYGPPQAPPGYPPAPQAGWGPGAYAPAPSEPGNGEAIAAFVLAIASLVMLLFSAGFSSVVSLACSIVAIFLGRTGKRKVDQGDTRKHRGLAQAGFIMGIIGVPLSILATVGWTLVFLSDSFQEGFEDSLEENQTRADLRLAVGLLGAAARTLFG